MDEGLDGIGRRAENARALVVRFGIDEGEGGYASERLVQLAAAGSRA